VSNITLSIFPKQNFLFKLIFGNNKVMASRLTGKTLHAFLRATVEPTTFDGILKRFITPDLSKNEIHQIRNKLRSLLGSGLRLGHFKMLNGHFLTDNHVEEVQKLLGSESQDESDDSQASWVSVDHKSIRFNNDLHDDSL